MFTHLLYLLLLLFSLVKGGWSHVGQPCNKLIRVCLASHSYCDSKNICRCLPEYPVNISLHSCRQGKHFNEKCDYTEECSYNDPNSYCTQLPYRSTCECHTGFLYNEIRKLCVKVGGDSPKSTNLIFPTAIGLSLAFASIICCCLVLWHVCKRQNLASAVFSRNRMTMHPQYLTTNRDSQRSVCVPSAPPHDESLPNYDTALTFKVSEDCDPPPSYEEVIGQESTSKTPHSLMLS